LTLLVSLVASRGFVEEGVRDGDVKQEGIFVCGVCDLRGGAFCISVMVGQSWW